MIHRKLIAASLLIATAACASGGNSAETAPEPATAQAPGRNADIITAAEFEAPGVADLDGLDAITRLRPRFFATRAGGRGTRGGAAGAMSTSTSKVSIDGGSLVTTDELRKIRASHLAEVRYLNAEDAMQRFGSSAGGSVLVVTTKRS